MSLQPLYDRIVIKVSKQDEKTSGGIIIPDTAKEKPIEGKVVAVGKGTRIGDKCDNFCPLEVKVGDTVLFAKWGGTEVKINGEELIIMKESDVMGIIK